MPHEGPKRYRVNELLERAKDATRDGLTTKRPLPSEPKPEYKPPLSEREMVATTIKRELLPYLTDFGVQQGLGISAGESLALVEGLSQDFLDVYDLMENRSYRQPLDRLTQELVHTIHRAEQDWSSTTRGRLILAFLYELERERVRKDLAPDDEIDKGLLLDERTSFFTSDLHGDVRLLHFLEPMITAEIDMRAQGEFVYYGTPPWEDVLPSSKALVKYQVTPFTDDKNFSEGRELADFFPQVKRLASLGISEDVATSIVDTSDTTYKHTLYRAKIFNLIDFLWRLYIEHQASLGISEEDLAVAVAAAKKNGDVSGCTITTPDLIRLFLTQGYIPATPLHLIGYAHHHWTPATIAEAYHRDPKHIIYALIPYKYITEWESVGSNGFALSFLSTREENGAFSKHIGTDYPSSLTTIAWDEHQQFLVFKSADTP